MEQKAESAPRTQTNKISYMRDEAFADLKEALQDALTFERGKRRQVRVTRIRVPRGRRNDEPG